MPLRIGGGMPNLIHHEDFFCCCIVVHRMSRGEVE